MTTPVCTWWGNVWVVMKSCCNETKVYFPFSSQSFTVHQTTLPLASCCCTVNQNLVVHESIFSALSCSIPLQNLEKFILF